MSIYTVQASAGQQVSDAGKGAVDGVSSWLEDPMTKEWLITNPLRILLIIIIALVLQWLARKIINRAARANIDNGGKKSGLQKKLRGKKHVKPEETDPRVQAMRDSREKRRQSRVRTLAAVGKSAAGIVIWVWAVLAILDQVGVNVAPLIASAGVIGLAIGFGAQSLVKDFIAGVFMLLEDQYGVGDTIDVGDGVIGDVEDISLRITTIRDIDGTLWYIRNGEILRVGNLSDEYSIARIEIPVALTNDTEKAWDVILDAITDAAKDPSISEGIIDAPEVNGLTTINPDYVTFRASVKTLPAHQWDVQRIIQSKLINRLREEGITLPYPHGMGFPRPQES
ncbi:mechanosensitive ion channel family protein [Corynebacterium tapiri]|uniref:Mechanosensitive ion channel family protein n=1 Tax=Corynebacterium tapiri TaxID=1448266 RepID=A0A5C4U3E0_9CORY|nr:mechanosensitive ion channel family protein [Corynebacterium tapiri]TNL94875.1 mechanosensitive ion channel family protein [Corynebacterium tapiri]